MTTLVKVPKRRRVGAIVIAPDGEPATVWSYSSRIVQLSPRWWDTLEVRELYLWRDGELLDVIPEAESRDLEVLELHPVHRAGVRDCSRRNHRAADPAATECPTCGATIGALR